MNFFFIFHLLFSQNVISGKVLDEASKQPLEFAHIIKGANEDGSVTDNLRQFSLETADHKGQLEFQAIGYQSIKVNC